MSATKRPDDLIARLREPRAGIHEDGTEELKTWDVLFAQCRDAADALESRAPVERKPYAVDPEVARYLVSCYSAVYEEAKVKRAPFVEVSIGNFPLVLAALEAAGRAPKILVPASCPVSVTCEREGECSGMCPVRDRPAARVPKMDMHADLIARLYECRRMIGDMCSEGRPPKMSIPCRPELDEDIVICRTISEAVAALGGTVEPPASAQKEPVLAPDAACPNCHMLHFGGKPGFVCGVTLPGGFQCGGILVAHASEEPTK